MANLGELLRAQILENFFQFCKEQHLLAAAAPWPELEEAIEDWNGRIDIFFNILKDAVGELLMVHGKAFRFVQWDQCSHKELQMLLLERNRKAIDDGPKNLQ
jgi:hypothetical protein